MKQIREFGQIILNTRFNLEDLDEIGFEKFDWWMIRYNVLTSLHNSNSLYIKMKSI